jgi:glyoxylase-like metal-dependent hydrolase (beta-lactamase superfamily II)
VGTYTKGKEGVPSQMKMQQKGLGKLEELSKNLYAVIGEGDTPHTGYGANQFFCVSGEGVVVIDTGFDMPIAQNLKKIIGSKTDKHIRAVINTHHHSDHHFGNCVLVEEGKTATFAQEYCKEKIMQDSKRLISDYREKGGSSIAKVLEGVEIVVPRIRYKEHITIIIGDFEFELIHPPRGAHTLGDTYVYFRDRKLVVAGDLLWNRYYPNCEDAYLPGWLETLETIKNKAPKASTFVPGHGEVCDRDDFESFQRYIKQITYELKQISDMTEEEVELVFKRYGSSDWAFKSICQHNAKRLITRNHVKNGNDGTGIGNQRQKKM